MTTATTTFSAPTTPALPDDDLDLRRRFRALEIVRAAEKLVTAIGMAENLHGGLLTRDTIRIADELRVLLLRFRKDPTNV